MTISAGSKIGSYEILSPLGEGGMGEVWRAHDTRINRDVAIKVLPEEVTANPDRLARFEQEAQAAGALNHPNILTVFEMGTHEGHPYLVTELLEGASLRDKLGDTHRGSTTGEHLPVRKALEIGAQIANGLAAAHEKGIVHRDLKPENIFVMTDGRVKILDFGLAKLTATAGESNLTDAQTAQRQTSPGTVMGTAGYMAPEQVRGQNADHRVDIFACGVVLYEMLSGRRAFEGQSSADTMSAILKEDPPALSTDELRVPLTVDRIVRRCLEKETSQRFQSARDLAFALDAAEASTLTSGQSVAIVPEGRKRSFVLPVTAVAMLVVGLLVGMFVRMRQKPDQAAASASASVPDDEASFVPLTYRDMTVINAALAPDRRTVVLSALERQSPSIYTVSPDYPEPREAGLSGAHFLAVSSKGEMAVLTDARYLTHRFCAGTLARVPIGGTGPRKVLDSVRHADWSPDGNELAVIHWVDGIDRLEYPIGTVLAQTPSGYLSDLRVSPRGDHIAYFDHPNRWDNRGSLRIIDLSGNSVVQTEIYFATEGLAWSPDGEHVYYSASDKATSSLAIQTVDLQGKTRVVRRNPEDLVINDVGQDETLLVTTYRRERELWARGPGMAEEKNVSWLDNSLGFISPDGHAIAFCEMGAFAGPNYAVCLRSPVDGPVVRLGDGIYWDISPDGKWVLSGVLAEGSLVAYPTGVGEVKTFDTTGLGVLTQVGFIDAERFLVCDSESRCYEQPLDGGPRKAIPFEGDTQGSGYVLPDGEHFVVAGIEFKMYSIVTGEETPIRGFDDSKEFIAGWSADAKTAFVVQLGGPPFVVERLDIQTGRRSPGPTITPQAAVGGGRLEALAVTKDGKSYSYTVVSLRTRLFTMRETE